MALAGLALCATAEPQLASPVAAPPQFNGLLGSSGNGRFVLLTGETSMYDRIADIDIPFTFSFQNQPISVFLISAASTPDGRYVAFSTFDSGLVLGDNVNFFSKVYRRDTQAGTNRLVSVSTAGTPANERADFVLGMSADGNLVLFGSRASNLVPGFNPQRRDALFLRNIAAGTTRAVSVAPNGVTQLSISNELCAITPDGASVFFIAFSSSTRDIYRYDVASGTTAFVAPSPATPVAFSNGAGSILSLNFSTSNSVTVTEAATGLQTIIDVSAAMRGRTQSFGDISDDGRTFVIDVDGDNFGNDLIVFHRGSITEYTAVQGGVGNVSQVSADGSTILPNGAIGFSELNIAPSKSALYRTAIDTASGEVDIVEAGEPRTGSSTRPSVSPDGSQVAYVTRAFIPNSNPTSDGGGFEDEIIIRDLAAGLNVRVPRPSSGDRFSNVETVLAADNGRLAFLAESSDGLPPFPDGLQLWTYEPQFNLAILIRPFGGLIPTGVEEVLLSDISGDGAAVLLETDAALIPGDTNGEFDIYLYDTQAFTGELISRAGPAASGNGPSGGASITADGDTIVFVSIAPQFVTAGLPSFVRYTRSTGVFETFAIGPIPFGFPDVADDGRTIAVAVLAEEDTESPIATIEVYDLPTATLIARLPTLGGDSNAPILGPTISGDGGTVVFQSAASNLVPGDTNNAIDVFAWDVAAGTVRRISTDAGGGELPSGGSVTLSSDRISSVSRDGRVIAFETIADLDPADRNPAPNTDIYVVGVPDAGGCSPADVDASGDLDLFDILEFFRLFTTGSGVADFADDGLLDLFDIIAFFRVFAQGC